jgi:hypothetical protein
MLTVAAPPLDTAGGVSPRCDVELHAAARPLRATVVRRAKQVVIMF